MPIMTEEMREIMEAQDQQKTEYQELAGRIMVFARDQIMVSMRFLDRALFRMPMVPADTVATYGVNGQVIYYNTDHVLHSYKEEKNRCTRAFLHMIFHCIFSHPFQYEKMDRECWDLACDIAVEKTILDLKIADTQLASDGKRERVIRKLEEQLVAERKRERVLRKMASGGKQGSEFSEPEELLVSDGRRHAFREWEKQAPALTAERLYRFFADNPSAAQEFIEQAELFEQDDHLHWIPKRETDAADRTGDTITTDTRTAMIGCHEADTGEDGEQADDIDEALVGQSQDDWADISQHAKTDIETFSREQGFGAGSLLRNLQETLREKQDYGAFLRKFAVLGEEMHINDDEFDYIYYTYGLQLYENMPLVEPLEYRENKRIREFVIALDTSGSCQGATVEKFLRKTYDILKNTESYFKRVNIHIIQCDSKIQRDVKVTTDEEFDAYMQDVQLAGFGGTDFRPVFTYVDDLIARHEFHNLRGLIYFTDGQGTFPEHAPDYETAFVFIEEGFTIPETPPWAIRLVLREDEV
ncbi:MAG: VWA-like domain-containing protein [Clostridiales bacterium]|nr:VWA-like domain-containing protein [Clostridiales bacterium]